jgi:RNA polymerase sigma-70 factor (ECF subfamily)
LTGERGIEGSIAIIAESLSNTDYLAVTDTTACNDDRRVTASEVVAEADGVSPFCISPLPHEPRETGNTDAELKARFQQDAMPLREPLYRYALRLTTNHYDAEDLFQDTMVKAYSAFESFRPGTNLNGWLHRIMANTYVSTYRRRRRQPVQYSTADITDQQLAAQAAHSSTGLRSAEDEVLKELPDTEIAAAMRAMPEPIRMAVYYADVEGFRYREIAEVMDTSVGTVMSRLHRGRRRLRTLLATSPSRQRYRRATDADD